MAEREERVPFDAIKIHSLDKDRINDKINVFLYAIKIVPHSKPNLQFHMNLSKCA